MNKTFTKAVPNEIYIDDFSENKTAEYEYNGPETLLIETYGAGGNLIIVDERRPLAENSDVRYVELDANERPDVAYFLLSRSELVEHTFEELINDYDGSTYLSVTNPRMQDYYSLWYDPTLPDPWIFTLIVRKLDSGIELKVKNDRDMIESKLGSVALPDDLATVYNSYMTECNTWLADKAPLHPWKFVEFPAGNVPKIPYVLLKTISELSAYGAT